jgi:hypothetical protein
VTFEELRNDKYIMIIGDDVTLDDIFTLEELELIVDELKRRRDV